MRDLRPLLDKLLPDLVDFRRDLHQHPECSYREERTAARVLELKEIPDIELRTGVAGTGIVATLAGDKAGPCVALRADMDALPIEEQSNALPSLSGGRHHARLRARRAYDLHGWSCADARRMRRRTEGPVKFIFQPAEEGGAGGKRMCQEGALDGPEVAAIFGLHGAPDMEVGEIFLRTGPVLASADEFEIAVEGLARTPPFRIKESIRCISRRRLSRCRRSWRVTRIHSTALSSPLVTSRPDRPATSFHRRPGWLARCAR